MTDRAEALLQARLDGELTSAERAELEQILAGDASARVRAGELEALLETLNLLGPVDPPARVIHTVIDHINESAPAAMESSPLTATGGAGMRTKVLWGLAAAAAIVLAVFAYKGFPPDLGGSEGAIGAATRYQAGQIAASDVKLGDQATQEFLQSDLFDKLMKDESVRKALSDPGIRQALADPAIRVALADSALRAALTDPEMRKALSDPGIRAALNDPAMRVALSNPGIAKALRDPSLAAALASADLRAALTSNGLAAALKSPQFGEAMRVAR
jgi:hypothetical protein